MKIASNLIRTVANLLDISIRSLPSINSPSQSGSSPKVTSLALSLLFNLSAFTSAIKSPFKVAIKTREEKEVERERAKTEQLIQEFLKDELRRMARLRNC